VSLHTSNHFPTSYKKIRDMPTSNVPLTYAVKTSEGVIHLFILYYSNTRPNFPQSGTPVGNDTLVFNIQSSGTPGSNMHFEHYAFDAGSITDININFNFNSGTKQKKLEVEDFDIDDVPTLDTSNNKKALDAPYGLVQKVDSNNYKCEMVVFAIPGRNFAPEHSGPIGSEKNTFSKIKTNGNSPISEFTEEKTFNVTSFIQSTGSHELSVEGDPPKKRRTKTKNRNVTIMPFPRKRTG
jgi:hypothetical protein